MQQLFESSCVRVCGSYSISRNHRSAIAHEILLLWLPYFSVVVAQRFDEQMAIKKASNKRKAQAGHARVLAAMKAVAAQQQKVCAVRVFF